MNHAQRQYLKRFGVSTPQELPNPSRKLEYCELEGVPDPEPEAVDDSLHPQARAVLNGRTPEELDETDKLIFDYWKSQPQPEVGGPATKAAPRTTIDTAKLVALDPVARLSIVRAAETIANARAERAAGTDPRLHRISDTELARAEMHARPFWNDEC